MMNKQQNNKIDRLMRQGARDIRNLIINDNEEMAFIKYDTTIDILSAIDDDLKNKFNELVKMHFEEEGFTESQFTTFTASYKKVGRNGIEIEVNKIA